MKQIMQLTLAVAVALMIGGAARAIELPTAKGALALANEQVDASVKDMVIVIRGLRADTNLRPRIWEITLYDTNRLNDGTVVKVKDGAVISTGSSLRMFDDGRGKNFSRNFSGYWPEEVINVGRWSMDSDQLIETVRSHPRLLNYTVTEVSMVLRKLSDGNVPPAWRIRIRARPNDDPARERWVGYLTYNAESGELLRDELTVGN